MCDVMLSRANEWRSARALLLPRPFGGTATGVRRDRHLFERRRQRDLRHRHRSRRTAAPPAASFEAFLGCNVHRERSRAGSFELEFWAVVLVVAAFVPCCACHGRWTRFRIFSRALVWSDVRSSVNLHVVCCARPGHGAGPGVRIKFSFCVF